MTYTIHTASMIHDRQVAAVSTLQSLVVKAVETLAGLTDKAPKAPEKLSSTLEEVAAPLTRIVGTPGEVQAYAVASSREWLEVQHQFQTALLDAVSPAAATEEVPKETAAENS